MKSGKHRCQSRRHRVARPESGNSDVRLERVDSALYHMGLDVLFVGSSVAYLAAITSRSGHTICALPYHNTDNRAVDSRATTVGMRERPPHDTRNISTQFTDLTDLTHFELKLTIMAIFPMPAPLAFRPRKSQVSLRCAHRRRRHCNATTSDAKLHARLILSDLFYTIAAELTVPTQR